METQSFLCGLKIYLLLIYGLDISGHKKVTAFDTYFKYREEPLPGYIIFIDFCCLPAGRQVLVAGRTEIKKPNQLYIHNRMGFFDALIYCLNKTRQSVVTIGHPALKGERLG